MTTIKNFRVTYLMTDYGYNWTRKNDWFDTEAEAKAWAAELTGGWYRNVEVKADGIETAKKRLAKLEAEAAELRKALGL